MESKPPAASTGTRKRSTYIPKTKERGDRTGDMVDLRSREIFWSAMSELAPGTVDELVSVMPAIRATKRWSQTTAHLDEIDAISALDEFYELVTYLDFLIDHPDVWQRRLEAVLPFVGSLAEWPVQHVIDWAARNRLDSPMLKADMYHTLTQSFFIGDGDQSPPLMGPILGRDGIPSEILPYGVRARVAAEASELTPAFSYYPPNPLFNDGDIGVIVEALRDPFIEHGESLNQTRAKLEEAHDWFCRVSAMVLER